MDALWPDFETAAAGANLRKALHEARGALEGVVSGSGARIMHDGDFLALEPQKLSLDVARFRTDLARARRAGAVDDYEEALAIYRGELLPDDRYDEWAAGPRRDLQVEFLSGLAELVALLEARGEISAAIDAARRLVNAEQIREEGHALLIRLYALAGRRTDALRQYELLTQVLDEELGTQPGPDVTRLYEEIRARRTDEPELSSELWERVGDLRVLSGDASGAAKAFELALAAAPEIGTRARLERKSAEAWLLQHRPDMAGPFLANAERSTTDLAEQGRLARALANAAWESGEFAQAQLQAERALALATEHGTSDDVAAAHEALGIVSHFQGRWRDGLTAELERLTTEDSSQLARVYDIHHCIGQYHLYGDGLSDSVEAYARAVLERAEDAGAMRAQAFAWCLLGESLLLQARWEEADGCLARSCELHRSLGSRSAALPWQRRAELAASRGAYDEAQECLRAASAIATVSAMARHIWARIYATSAFSALEQDNAAEAVRFVEAAAAAAVRYGECPTCSALLNPIAAQAYAVLGDAPNAHSYADAAAVVASMFNSSAWQAMAESAAGSAAVADGDFVAARKLFDEARSRYEIAGQPYWAGRTRRLADLLPV
jgi:DNA-binding SARP family transcriptional activator